MSFFVLRKTQGKRYAGPVHWLTYPTELGKAPDEIESISKITYLFKKDVYHVFRYRTDSDTLDDAPKNKGLIG